MTRRIQTAEENLTLTPHSPVATPPSALQAPPHLKLGSGKTWDGNSWCNNAHYMTPSWIFVVVVVRSWGELRKVSLSGLSWPRTCESSASVSQVVGS